MLRIVDSNGRDVEVLNGQAVWPSLLHALWAISNFLIMLFSLVVVRLEELQSPSDREVGDNEFYDGFEGIVDSLLLARLEIGEPSSCDSLLVKSIVGGSELNVGLYVAKVDQEPILGSKVDEIEPQRRL